MELNYHIEYLERFMEENNMTREELAKFVGVSKYSLNIFLHKNA